MDPQTLHCMSESISWVVRDYETAVDAMSTSSNIPRAFVGDLELDSAESNLVAQEVLSHSIARSTVMLQDIEEEVSLQRQQLTGNYSLQEKDLKELVTRLFRLLGRVNRLDTEAA